MLSKRQTQQGDGASLSQLRHSGLKYRGTKIGDKIIYTDRSGIAHKAVINHIEPNGMVGVTLGNGNRVFPVRSNEWEAAQ